MYREPRFGLAAITITALLALSACGGEQAPGAAGETAGEASGMEHVTAADTTDTAAADAGVTAEWHNFGNDGNEKHYSPVDHINTANIDGLGLEWYFDLPSENTMTAPVMADGKLFITTGHSHIRALDAVTG